MIYYNRWNIVLLKIVYMLVLFLGLNNIPVIDQKMIFATPIFISVSNVFLLWFNRKLFNIKTKRYHITLTIWTIIMMLSFIINMYVMFSGIIVIILEVFYTIKDKLTYTVVDDYIIKYHDSMIIGSSLFLAIGFSILHTSINQYVFISILIVLLLIPLLQIHTLLKKIKFILNDTSLINFIAINIFFIFSFILIMKSYVLYDGGLKIRFDYIIYSIILMIYPLTSLRIYRLNVISKLHEEE